MATPLKATYDASGNLSGFAELQVVDTFNVPKLAIFANAIQETKQALAANAIDLATGSVFTKTITAATTFTVSNVPATGTVSSFILELTNAGSQTLTWFTGVKWAAGLAPTLTSAGKDILGFYSHDGGTTWNGFVVGLDVK